jgi:hypothetical protein
MDFRGGDPARIRKKSRCGSESLKSRDGVNEERIEMREGRGRFG